MPIDVSLLLMRLFRLVVLTALLSSFALAAENAPLSSASQGFLFFVATNGNDNWSGRQPEANRSKTDGPFVSLSRALQAVRNAKRSTSPAGTSTIQVRGGLYLMREPLVLTPSDSGLKFSSYRNEKPILSGGRRISGWSETKVGDKTVWTASVPEAHSNSWIFRELWVNGQRATRARHPNKGYFSIADLADKPTDWTKGLTRFRFREGDLKAWNSITNAEVVVMTKWVESRLPVVAVDEPQRLVSFSKRSVFELAPGDPYYVEGALELLDQPGEWYLDASAGKIFYMPRPGEKLGQLEAIAPVLTQVLRLEGKPEQTQFIEQLFIKGLTFSHTEWYFPVTPPNVAPELSTPEVGGFSQAAIGVPAAVWGEGLRQCSFEACSFCNLGNYALELGRGSQSNRIHQCDFFDLGAGGPRIGETSFRDKAEEQTRANDVIDCHVHDGGKMFHSAIGIWIGQSPENHLTHNLIHDFYYTGISIGWTWGYGRAFASSNLVAFNHVHHIGVKSDSDGPILSDMGGIYTLGKQPGTRIINNLWHDIAATRYGGWGIYFDEGSSGILAESNVVHHTTHGGFHQHYGETNMVQNNIFAFGRDQQIQRSRVEPHLSFAFQSNIVYFDSGILLANEWADNNFSTDYNCYFDAREKAKPDSISFGKASLEEWRARGHDVHSIIADPLFVNSAKNDFHLKPGSPALKLGFRSINLTEIGPRTGNQATVGR